METRVLHLEKLKSVKQALDYLEEQQYEQMFHGCPKGFTSKAAGQVYLPEELRIEACHAYAKGSHQQLDTLVYAVKGTDGAKGVIIDDYYSYPDQILGDHLVRMKLWQFSV